MLRSALQPLPLWTDGCPLPKPRHIAVLPPSRPAPCPPSFPPLPAAFHLLSTGAWAERFTLHMATGELRTATVLRRSDRAEYIFTVTASDRGTVPRSTSAIIRVQVPSTPAPPVPAPSAPCSPLGGHHPATWQPPSLPSHPPLLPSQGTFCPCSAVDLALKTMWRTWDVRGWVYLPLSMLSFVEWSTALIVSSAVPSRLGQPSLS